VQGEFSLGELAVRFGLGLRGEPDLTVSRVATLSHADAGSLSFLANTRYRRQMESTRATAVLVGPENAADCPVAALIDPNPYLAYARIADLLHPQAAPEAGIHSSAVVSMSARIADSASVGPLCVVEDDVEIGERVFLGPGCIVQRGARVGAGLGRLSEMSEGECVAMSWACEMGGLVEAARQFPDRFLWLDFERFLASPADRTLHFAPLVLP